MTKTDAELRADFAKLQEDKNNWERMCHLEEMWAAGNFGDWTC